MSRPGRVLSIQSHVVHGHVGNKSAIFPMQLLGLDVDPINSVQFSNHTGYAGGFTGDRLTGEQLATLFGGLEANALTAGYTHLLTGYIGNDTFLQHLLEIVAKLRAVNPDLVYVCDPVMGDDGKLYVPEELVKVYREDVVSLATVLTPNQFECELLSECTISDMPSALRAMDVLHSKGPRVIFLTSSSFGDAETELTVLISAMAGAQLQLSQMTFSVSSPGGADASAAKQQHQIIIPKLTSYFTGTGDLIAAVFLAWYHKEPEAQPYMAAEKAVATVQGVLSRTIESMEAASAAGIPTTDPKTATAAPPELALIASKDIIEAPRITCRATPIERQTSSPVLQQD